MRQPRPKGPHFEITPAWVKWVEERLGTLGISQEDLADRIVDMGEQATGSAISDLLAGKRSESRLVPFINKALGGRAPVQFPLGYEAGLDETRARIRDKLKDLPDEDARLVLAFIDRITKGR